MLEKDELLKYPNFLLSSYQNDIYNILIDYMEKNGLNQKEFAKEVGITEPYLSQVLNGNFNFTLKKVIQLALKVGKVPHLEFLDIDDYWKMVDESKTTYDYQIKLWYLNNQVTSLAYLLNTKAENYPTPRQVIEAGNQVANVPISEMSLYQ